MRKWSQSSYQVRLAGWLAVLAGHVAVSIITLKLVCDVWTVVGEEDEVSIRDVAHMIAEAMEFKGELVVS